jgi:predicted secreted hydrolase
MFKLLVFLWLGSLAAAPSWNTARPDHIWRFPREHWSHPGYRIEWWYFTGQLEARTEPERRWGYQFTFFRVGLLPERPPLASNWASENLILGHAAVTDLTRGEHRFSELLYRAVPFLGGFGEFPDPRLAWSHGPPGTEAGWSLRRSGEGFQLEMADRRRATAFHLTTTPVKPVVLQGPNGYSRKASRGGAASLYYSFTRMRTEGTLDWSGERLPVRGESWMDREWSTSSLGPEQVGWDWFGLRLDGGRELMLYSLRKKDGRPDFRYGTLVERNGKTRYLSADEWSLAASETWTSPATGARYPARWRLEIRGGEGLRMEVVPELADQENRSELPGGVFYWEGAVRVLGPEGAKRGEGYVELTGYGEGSRPPV